MHLLCPSGWFITHMAVENQMQLDCIATAAGTVSTPWRSLPLLTNNCCTTYLSPTPTALPPTLALPPGPNGTPGGGASISAQTEIKTKLYNYALIVAWLPDANNASSSTMVPSHMTNAISSTAVSLREKGNELASRIADFADTPPLHRMANTGKMLLLLRKASDMMS